MVATTLRAGDIAVIGYNTGQTDVNGSTVESVQVVLLRDIGSSTTFFLTDRSWTATPGSSALGAGTFSNSGVDGTTTYTAGSDMAAGTVINIPINGGFDLDQNGEAFYIYQGAVNAPTAFMFALELGDGNTTFAASLVNTGLTAGVTAVGVAFDSGAYHGPSTEAFAHLYNGERLLENIADATNWSGDDATAGGTPKALDQPDHSGPYNTAPNFSLWTAASGGGGAVAYVGGDPTVNSGNSGYNHAQLFTDMLVGGITQFWGPRDLTFDTVHGKFFMIDSDGTGGHNRVLQGNISDLLGNPSAMPALTVLFNDPTMAIASLITNIEVDPQNGIVYFTQGAEFNKVVYNTANQAGVTLANIGAGSGNPNGTANNTFDDFVINFANGNVYLSSHRIVSAADGDQVTRNYVYRISGLDPADGAGAFTFGNGLITVLPMSPDDDDANNGINFAAGEGFPQEIGTVEGLALSADGNTLYIATAKTLYDHDGDGGVIGGPGTDPILTPGGIYSYALTGNPTGTYTAIYTPTDDGNDGSAAINNANGPQGIIDDLEIDPVTGHLFFTDLTGDQLSPSSNPPGDEGIWRIDLDGTPNAVFFQSVNNINSLNPASLFLNRAPNVLSSSQATPGVTEASSAPGSGLTALVQPFLTLDVTDFETADQTDQLAGAVVYVSNNFQSGATHQDRLTINGATSGTLDFGSQDITFNYNSATGAMTLTGTSTFNNYESAIALVRFNTSGDDVTAYGAATNRTISWVVSDGLNHSDAVSTTVTVTGINDAPVNNGMTGTFSGAALVEDAVVGAALAGVTVTDVDADPASQNLVMTFTVSHGTLTFLTNVTGGIVGADITGGANGSATVTITATQNEINATLGAAGGLTYIPTANFNGNDTLNLVSNDQGFNGNDPGNSGTGTTEADTDNKTIFVSAVNDAPVRVGDGTEVAAAILEDEPLTNATAPTVNTLFSGQFSDATDNQSAFGGSSANNFAGIAVVGNGSSGATGQWQYWDGAAWQNVGIPAANQAIFVRSDAPLRFSPASNYNGAAPTLTVHLVDDSAGSPTSNGASINLLVVVPGGTTFLSALTVTLDQTVTAVNDAPVNTVGGSLDIQEDDPATNVTGVSVFDLEANPATDLISVTLDVDHGTLAILTNVAGGITAGDIVSQDADTISILATQNQINTTLAAAGGLTYDSDANYFGGDTLEVTTSDLGFTGQDPVPGTGTGSDEQDVDSKVINIASVDDPATTAADADDVNEDGTVNIDVLANDSDIDTTLAVVEVDGQAIALGATITLTGSGATVKREMDGTLTYNPNDQFNYLITAAEALATGAVNDTATDTFSYELAGGETANVTVTVHGVDSPEDVLMGDGTDNTINGTGGTDFFYVMQTGTETLDGMGGNDAFLFGAFLDATDDVDGGAGTGDQLGIQGDYSGGLTLGANNLVNIETLVLLSGTDTRFGDPGTNLYDYDITTVDANVPHNGLLKVQFNTLVAGEDVTFDGSAEASGAFFFYAGQGQDDLTGGGGNDAFFFGHNGSAPAFTAADQVDGGGGVNDQLGLRGDYANLITFGSTTMQNVEVLVAISSTDARFGNTGSNFHYNLKTHDDNVGATKTLSVTGAMLTATEGLTFDGSSELDGQFDIKGGKGTDVLIGGALADLLFGNEGQDNLTGGGGNDTFRYRLAADSAVGDEDQILDFTAGDKIDLTMMDANSNTAANDAFTFSNDGTFHGVAGELRAYESSPGTWFVEGDRDGGGTADFAIQVTLTNPLAPLTASDFNL